MLPARSPDVGKSEAEHDVFEMLCDELSPEWTCLHSLGFAKHDRKVWAEIDFVLIGPPGILCLEVKGGHLARGDGIWTFRNRNGRENSKREGPFEQVGSAAGALKAFFRTTMREVLNSIVGCGVVMPDVPCTMRGPDVDPEVVVDKTTIGEGMKAYVERLAAVWRARYREQHGRDPRPLSRSDREAVIALLRGDFDLVPSLPTRIGWANRELIRLTTQQSDLLARLEENRRVLVRGGAGTGKTVIAFEDAVREAKSGARVLFLCFNRLLADSLRNSSPQGLTVSTLHSLMARLIREAGLWSELPEADDNDLFEVFYPVLALQALEVANGPRPYDVLVIDEGQDILLSNYLDVLDKLLVDGLAAGRWRMFYDPNQNIFNGVGGPAMGQLLSYNPTRYPLTVNCRNTEQIADATAMFSGCERLEAVAQGPRIETLWYRDRRDQRRVVSNCVRRLLSQGVRPRDIVILSTTTLRHSCLADGWQDDVGARLIDVAERRQDDEGAVGFSTIAAFKGLEADVVVLLDGVSQDRSSRYLTYVGASRARAGLSILLDEANAAEVASRYEEFGQSLTALTDAGP